MKVLSRLDQPVFVTTAPGETGWFIVEQPGRIKYWDFSSVSTVLDISDRVRSGGEMGLLSVAFHPQYVRNGRFFLYYTRRGGLGVPVEIVISELTRGEKTERVLLTIKKRYTNHNGGQLAFGPDGYLYAGTGDGGSAGDPQNNAQNTHSLLGKILRLGVDTLPYTIPPDNPFAKGGGRPEVFALGLRNPWRFSFDRKGGELWAADVGQFQQEEINRIEKEGNYGWNVLEGTRCYLNPLGCESKGYQKPVWVYGRSEGFSVTGGYVYRGKKHPTLTGKYLFGDYGSGNIWALSKNAAGWSAVSLVSTGYPIASFGEEAGGELVVVSHAGALYRLEN